MRVVCDEAALEVLLLPLLLFWLLLSEERRLLRGVGGRGELARVTHRLRALLGGRGGGSVDARFTNEP